MRHHQFQVRAEACDRLVLHPAGEGDLGVTVLLVEERILPEAAGEGAEHRAEFRLDRFPGRAGRRVVVEDDRHRVGRLAGGVGDVVILVDRVRVGRERDEVGGDRMPFFPMERALRAGRGTPRQSAVRHDLHPLGHRHLDRDRVGLVARVILAGPPAPRAARSAEAPGQRLPADGIEPESIARLPGGCALVIDRQGELFPLPQAAREAHDQEVVLLPEVERGGWGAVVGGHAADYHLRLEVELHAVQPRRRRQL